VDLREELAVVAEEARSGVDPIMLRPGAKRRPPAGRRLPPPGVALHHARRGRIRRLVDPDLQPPWSRQLGGTAITLLRDGLLVALLVNGWFLYRNRAKIATVVTQVEEAAHELGLLSEC
jgi:hypothetical protein